MISDNLLFIAAVFLILWQMKNIADKIDTLRKDD